MPPNPRPPSRYQLHVLNWENCLRCELGEQRDRICLARGTVPCDVLFIGEAPGVSENVIGSPFVGPAGKLLDDIIARSVPENLRNAFTNLVACFPREAKEAKTNEPEPEHIKACAPRLAEFINLSAPRLVVCVGTLSQKWVGVLRDGLGLGDVRLTGIVHPAAILRANIAQRGLAVQKCIVTIANAVEEVFNV
jgi:DNA polymerase